ncbi:MAG: hypothetical protein ACJARP_000584 [Vicingaceae bacterium]
MVQILAGGKMRKKGNAIIVLIFIVSQLAVAQKNLIRNSGFELFDKNTNPSDLYNPSKSIKYWSRYSKDSLEIEKNRNWFIIEKTRNSALSHCGYGFKRKYDVVIKEGRFAALFTVQNIEFTDSGELQNNNCIEYIVNDIQPNKKGIYSLSFNSAIFQQSRNVLSDSNFTNKNIAFEKNLYEGIKRSKRPQAAVNISKKDWDCTPRLENMLEITMLFTNVKPKGKLFVPQTNDLYIDTVINTSCKKLWEQYSFEFDLKERYKYFVIGYLPQYLNKQPNICSTRMNMAFDEFSLTYLKKSDKN